MARVVARCRAARRSSSSTRFDLDVTEATVRGPDPRQDRLADRRRHRDRRRPERRRARPSRRARYRRFGEKVGVAFQIVDDLFDYLSDPERRRQAGGLRPRRGQGDAAADRGAAQANERDRKRLRALAGASAGRRRSGRA
jgi:hypothetical protein